MDTVFERVIGLGSDCLTKKQINQYFCQENSWKQTKKGHADLFDWMVIHDYSLLADAFSNKLTDFFEENDFYGAILGGWKTLINQRYKMHWNHLFNKEYEGYWVTDVTGDLSKEAIAAIFPSIKIKIDHLKEKFIETKKNNSLYILHEKYYTFSKETLLKLRNSIIKLRDGNKNFSILLVVNRKSINNFENIYIEESSNIMPGWDGGDPIRWKEILDQFKFTTDIWD